MARHNDAMPSVQIKDVPESTHAVLRQRAAAAYQSLQEYLRSRLMLAGAARQAMRQPAGAVNSRCPSHATTARVLSLP